MALYTRGWPYFLPLALSKLDPFSLLLSAPAALLANKAVELLSASAAHISRIRV
jgi:hypothetical protein